MTAPESAAHGGTPFRGTAQDSTQIGRLLDELVERVPAVRHALVLAADGLPRGASRALGREDGEQLAAMASSFHSLARGVGRHFKTGGTRQTLVELDDAFLLVTAAGAGSALAVFAESDADIGQVAYEMALLVKRVGPLLATAPRGLPGAPG
ncbi:roadblock/LC7 domain-containing protein [Streptomyces marincola]|uniref:roadblock/LC7 domain-containing protein n=1 Tax=Streptomyces marincola TaxID=2878388 RepID=UPI001CF241AA|nr:roadblock/LC7 domain-containing protein [Streptomyces marincola]UCM86707.1 roadblock/LC7 domain-containing protein [Streptomyces marincola]